MYLPHLLKATHELLITHRFYAMPGRRIERVNVRKVAINCANMLNDGLDELLQLAVSVWRIAELCVAQFNWMDVVGALLGIDDQHAASRVTFGLRGEEGGGQLPLAGAAQGIGLRIVGQQRLRR